MIMIAIYYNNVTNNSKVPFKPDLYLLQFTSRFMEHDPLKMPEMRGK